MVKNGAQNFCPHLNFPRKISSPRFFAQNMWHTLDILYKICNLLGFLYKISDPQELYTTHQWDFWNVPKQHFIVHE